MSQYKQAIVFSDRGRTVHGEAFANVLARQSAIDELIAKGVTEEIIMEGERYRRVPLRGVSNNIAGFILLDDKGVSRVVKRFQPEQEALRVQMEQILKDLAP